MSTLLLGDAEEWAGQLAAEMAALEGNGHMRVVGLVPNEAGLPVRAGKVVSPQEVAAELLAWVPEGEWAGVPLRWVAVGGFVDRDFVEQVTRLLWRAGKPAVMVFEDPEVQQLGSGQLSWLPPSEPDPEFGSWLGRWLDGMMPPLSREGLVTLVAGLDAATLDGVLSGQLLFDVELGARILEVVRGWERDTRLRLEDRKFGAVQPYPTAAELGARGRFQLGPWLIEQIKRVNPALTHVDLADKSGLSSGTVYNIVRGTNYPGGGTLRMLLDVLSDLRYEARLAAKARLSGAEPPRRSDVNDDGTFKYGAWLSAQQAKIGNAPIAAELFTEIGLTRDYGLEILNGRDYPAPETHQALMDALEVLKRRAQVVKDSLGPSGAEDYAGWLWGRMEAQLSPEQLAARSGGVLSEEQVNGILNAQFDPSAETRQAVAAALRVFDREVRLAALERESGPLVLGPEGLEGLTGAAWREAYADWLDGQMRTFSPRLTPAKLVGKVRALDLDYRLNVHMVAEILIEQRKPDTLTHQGIAEALRVLAIEARSEREQLGRPLDLGPEVNVKDADGKWAIGRWLDEWMQRFQPALSALWLAGKVNNLYPEIKVSDTSMRRYRRGTQQPSEETRVAIAKTLHALEVERGMAPAPWGQGNAGALGQGGGGSSSAGPVGSGVQRYSGLEGMGAVGPRMGFQTGGEVQPERADGGASAMEIDGGFGLGVQELASGIDGMFGGSGSAGGLLGGAAPGSGAGGGVSVRWLGDADELAREFLAVDLVGVEGSGHTRVVAVVPNEAGLPVREGKVVSPEEAVAELLEWVPEGEWASVPLRWVAVAGFVDRDFVEQVTRLLWRAGKPAVMVFEDPEVLEARTGQVSVLPPSELDQDFGSWLGRWLDGMMPPLSREGLVTLVAGLDEATLRSLLSGQVLSDVELGARIVEVVRSWERDARLQEEERQLGAVKPFPTGTEKDANGKYLLGFWLREQTERINPGLTHVDLAHKAGANVGSVAQNWWGSRYPTDLTLGMLLDGLSVLRYEERLAAKARLSGAAPPRRADVNDDGTFKYGAWLGAQQAKIGNVSIAAELFTEAGLKRDHGLEILDGRKYPRPQDHQALMDALEVLKRRAQVVKDSLGPSGAEDYAGWLWGRMEAQLSPEQLAARSGGVLSEEQVNGILNAQFDPSAETRQAVAEVLRVFDREVRLAALERESGPLVLGPEGLEGLTGAAWRKAYADWLDGQMAAFTPRLTPKKLAAKVLDLDYSLNARTISEILRRTSTPDDSTRQGIAEALRVLTIEARSEEERLGGSLDLGPKFNSKNPDGKWASAGWLTGWMARFNPPLTVAALVDKVNKLYPKIKVSQTSISRYRSGETQPPEETRVAIAKTLHALEVERGVAAPAPWGQGNAGALGQGGGGSSSAGPVGSGVQRYSGLEGMGAVGPRMGFQTGGEVQPERADGGASDMEIDGGNGLGVQEPPSGMDDMFTGLGAGSAGGLLGGAPGSGAGGAGGDGVSTLLLGDAEEWAGQLAAEMAALEGNGHMRVVGLVPNEAGLPVREGKVVSPEEAVAELLAWVPEGEWAGVPLRWVAVGGSVDRDFVEQVTRLLWRAGKPAVMFFEDPEVQARTGQLSGLPPSELDLDFGSWLGRWLEEMMPPLSREDLVTLVPGLDEATLGSVLSGNGFVDLQLGHRIVEVVRKWESDTRMPARSRQLGAVKGYPTATERDDNGDFLMGSWLKAQRDRIDPDLSYRGLAAAVGMPVGTISGNLEGKAYPAQGTLNSLLDRLSALQYEERLAAKARLSGAAPPRRSDRNSDGTFKYGAWLKAQLRKIDPEPDEVELFTTAGLSRNLGHEFISGQRYPGATTQRAIMDALGVLERRAQAIREALGPPGAGPYAQWLEARMEQGLLDPQQLAVRTGGVLTESRINDILAAADDPTPQEREDIAAAWRGIDRELRVQMLEMNSGARLDLGPEEGQGPQAYAGWLRGQMGAFTPPLTPAKLAAKARNLDLDYRVYARVVSEVLGSVRRATPMTRLGIAEALRVFEMEARSERERLGGPLDLGPPEDEVGADGNWAYATWLRNQMASFKPELRVLTLVDKIMELHPKARLSQSNVSKYRTGAVQPSPEARKLIAEALRVLRREAEASAGGASSAGGSGAHGPLGGSPDSGVDPLVVGWPVGREVVFEGPRWGG
ncbi:helix-turn-helix transcriptional regulator, partial [Streptomyces tendae]|uniref:helix-turn-helix transcriptional regulator n=1 Tax=Streptomyces tendae TaxID=1932 RepID=UPI0037896C45